jgi:hypothetical protein
MTRFGVALGVLLAGAPALAQDTQYWNIQYGPIGQLLGGQVVGSTRDLSAAYYNPGGLALAENSALLLSVQAFKAETFSMKPVDGGAFLDTRQTSYATFPGFVAGAFPSSWLGEDTHLAFSILTRQQANLRVDQRLAGEGVPQLLANDVPDGRSGRYGLEQLFDQRMSETWGGLTLSRRISDRFGLGATVFGVYRGQRTRWEQSLQVVFPGGDGVSALIIDDYDYSHWRILAKVGLAWEGDTTRLGLAVTSPSAGLFGSGKAGYTRVAAGVDADGDGGPDTVLANGLNEDLDGYYASPWAVSAGGAWRRGSYQLHASAEWFAPVHRFSVLQGLSDSQQGTPLNLFQELQGVFNAGAGAEYWLGGKSADQGRRSGGTAIYAAFATDFSASPEIVRGEAGTSNQDWYHLTAGTALGVGRSRFSLGVSYAFGSKDRDLSFEGLPPGVPVIGQPRRVETRSSRWIFVVGYLFGSGR